MYKIKLHKTSKCLWSIYINTFVTKWMFFLQSFHKSLTQNYRTVLCKVTIDPLYFWDIYDVNLWEKLAITVKLCFTETRLKQGYDLQGYFLKTKETINILTITVIIFLNEHLLEAVNQRCSAKKKLFLKFHMCLWPATLLKKRLCYRCLNFVELLRTPFLIEHFQWLLLVFSLK